MKNYYVYIVASKNNVAIYIGVTNDLVRRVYEHKNKLLKGFTKKYNVEKLVYYEVFERIENAIQREKQLKNWHKDWKHNLIKEHNENYEDLYNEIVK